MLRAGMATSIQDWPGRTGYWQVGVPPSGPMDDLSFRLANIAVGNPEGASGLEATLLGPALRVTRPLWVCVTGAPAPVTRNGRRVSQYKPIHLDAGDVLDVGMVTAGLRTYLAVGGGLAADDYLGSASTFTLGRFGGHLGRTLVDGDVLTAALAPTGEPSRIPNEWQPAIGADWHLAVTVGPHSAPEFFTDDDIATLYTATYTVHFNSDRTGVRLIGPKPQWARPDGGEAGLHPSNIHDNAYSVGAVDFTGDTPILLGPDGPSLGGFVCPVTVTSADRWKLGQLAPDATLRFVPVDTAAAAPLAAVDVRRRASGPVLVGGFAAADDGILRRGVTADGAASITYRRSGDDNILVEYGEMELDLKLRVRGHALTSALADAEPGLDLTPGVRSVQVKFDPRHRSSAAVLDMLVDVEAGLAPLTELRVPSRTVSLPLSWDDPATREAIQRYMHGVRSDAPWCPWNIEFIRRMNGLGSVDDVHDVVFDAEYLVLGLGDVYLGAPVATPLDPRHRLVTTKYNPARTWTPENAVGIGGAYLCVYGMEGPGGYQFVGRTTQVWNHRHPLPAPGFDPEHPWLLRHFDRIRWFPVTAEELLDLRADTAAGRGSVDITDGEFSIADYDAFLAANAGSIAATQAQMESARADERERWRASGELGPAAPASDTTVDRESA
ncbi:5-oxoprolinase/urea amidolyase family protein [Gordonia sp. TBRC 11910]|uniref:5-oxoprolinase/urea amidolyase family protein n=1 Tax=Gordonia asplenii TaxID=2725283 RepID=A0A848KMI1_9ACTN|nr:5-oxoprolinase/urea amidolyase family protein [Gordonia asplenii]